MFPQKAKSWCVHGPHTVSINAYLSRGCLQCPVDTVCASYDLVHSQAIYEVDPQLLEHTAHLDYRWQQYQQTKEAIETAEGSLLEFAKVRVDPGATLSQSTLFDAGI